MFPRYLLQTVKRDQVMDLPEAIRKITSLPAAVADFDRRGLLKKGIRIDLGKESQAIPYAKIEKINESRDFFFLFLGPNAAYVIDKTGFTKGNVNEFRTFIAKKTALKYESTSLMRAMFPPRGMKKKK